MDIFDALAEPTRRDILEALAVSGQLSATDIYNKFHVSHPAISQHLKVLREAELVTVTKKAQQRIYQINPASLHEVEDWTQKIKQQWEQRFSRLDDLLRIEQVKLQSKEKENGV